MRAFARALLTALALSMTALLAAPMLVGFGLLAGLAGVALVGIGLADATLAVA